MGHRNPSICWLSSMSYVLRPTTNNYLLSSYRNTFHSGIIRKAVSLFLQVVDFQFNFYPPEGGQNAELKTPNPTFTLGSHLINPINFSPFNQYYPIRPGHPPGYQKINFNQPNQPTHPPPSAEPFTSPALIPIKSKTRLPLKAGRSMVFVSPSGKGSVGSPKT